MDVTQLTYDDELVIIRHHVTEADRALKELTAIRKAGLDEDNPDLITAERDLSNNLTLARHAVDKEWRAYTNRFKWGGMPTSYKPSFLRLP